MENNWITDFMEQYGYFGIFLLIALENVFPPIPSEVILTFGGFMTTYTSLTPAGSSSPPPWVRFWGRDPVRDRLAG